MDGEAVDRIAAVLDGPFGDEEGAVALLMDADDPVPARGPGGSRGAQDQSEDQDGEWAEGRELPGLPPHTHLRKDPLSRGSRKGGYRSFNRCRADS